MKKAFESFLVLIIFYGVYSAFSQIAPMFAPDLSEFWVIISSLLISALLLVLYAQIITGSAKKKLKATVSQLEKTITEKDQEIKSAQSFKDTIIKEAEETLE